MSELSANDRVLIADLHKKWMSEELIGNSTNVIEFCTDDVMWMPPQSPPLLGKEAVFHYLKETWSFIKDVKISNLSIKGNEGVAYLTSDYLSHFVPQGETATHEANGAHLWVLEKKGRVWLVAIVAWSMASLRAVEDEAAKGAGKS